MKTIQRKQTREKEIQWDQRDQKVRTDSNQLLEDDEKILHSETVENKGCTVLGLATPFFLIFGFPFYVVGGFIALTAYLSDKNLNEIVQAISWPAGLLLVVAVVSLIMAYAMRTGSCSKRRLRVSFQTTSNSCKNATKQARPLW